MKPEVRPEESDRASVAAGVGLHMETTITIYPSLATRWGAPCSGGGDVAVGMPEEGSRS